MNKEMLELANWCVKTATSSGIAKFKKELAPYGTSKGTVRFPLGKPIPYGLIAKITKCRVKEVHSKQKK